MIMETVENEDGEIPLSPVEEVNEKDDYDRWLKSMQDWSAQVK